MATLIWRRFRQHKIAMVASVVLILVCLMAILADVIAPQSPYFMNYDAVLAPPDSQHLLGTDNYGRDVWSRLCVGARISLSVGAIAVIISQVIGVLLGSIAGYYGGAVDSLIMRITDIMLCFPWLVFMLVLAATFGPGLSRTMLAIGITSWPGLARLVRGEFLSLRERDFVLAARCLGVPDRRLVMRHVLPNVVPYLVVNATFGIAGAIMAEASLSFLGLGVQIPMPSWGNMLTAAQSVRVLTDGPWFWLPPGLAISLTILAINFVGDGLRDALDPRALVE
jgi:peptide/nickel transport system permease protein